MAKKDPGFKLLNVGTERLKEKSNIGAEKAIILPSSVKGQKEYVRAIMVLDWDGELFTVSVDAPINIKRALSITYWSQLASNLHGTFVKGLKLKI